MFLIYVYVCEHKNYIYQNEIWVKLFSEKGLTSDQIQDISHDDDSWYYQEKSLCIGFSGDEGNERCKRHEVFCAGGKNIGSPIQQVNAVVEAINSGGQHNLCPLVYEGAD